ncbi:MAG TPA: PQQ-binding-like beta-propeller repeat protein, partial [Planctomycetaceae bacterium]|nr:PQQ-binding-like beta-propeller repeat protein [Planctomycetaceae bacterium]
MPDGDNVLWVTPIPGTGHSSPITWGDRVFVTTAVSAAAAAVDRTTATGRATIRDEGEQDWRLLALDRRTGRLLWQRTAHRGRPAIGRHPKASHANASPATDGRHVIAYFGSEGLHAYDVDGNHLWSRDLGVIDVGYVGLPEYQWGTASSPIIHDGLAIVQAYAQQGSFIAAFDIATGREVWRQVRDELPSWTTPVVAIAGGRPVLVTNSPRFIRGLDPGTGRELWRLADEAEVKVPSPVTGDGLVIVSGGAPRGRAFRAVRPDPGLDASDRVVWTVPKGGPYTPTPIIVEDLLYVLADNGVLSCYEVATGALVYQERVSPVAGSFSASPIAAAGRLYLAAEDGTVYVVRAGRRF